MDTYILFKQNYETSNTYEQINNHVGNKFDTFVIWMNFLFFPEQKLSK